MENYKYGEMDVSDQEKTFHGFLRLMTRGAIAIIVVLILLALING